MEQGKVVVDGIGIDTFTKEMVNANILEVTVGTTGYKGGDSGHGARTVLRLRDCASTDMRVRVDGDQVTIVFGGDAELTTFVNALKFAATILDIQRGQP